jgi:hypothetical protein
MYNESRNQTQNIEGVEEVSFVLQEGIVQTKAPSKTQASENQIHERKPCSPKNGRAEDRSEDARGSCEKGESTRQKVQQGRVLIFLRGLPQFILLSKF